ncbi:hypothetical protein BB560_005594 [Smittium megazygosporum]|uniref:E3 ubiquitin protein ligase n=1 Tax=Smittium megazygosporum TaxID=133381 RepID=A0A2T9Z2R6_9FUNG|nr:hypothetical protein BB560_005594 [Smittium megazygosporum]
MMTEKKRNFQPDLKSEEGLDLLAKRRKPQEIDKNVEVKRKFNNNIEQMIDMENIRNFQKEAIWRQMNEYKRESLKDKAHVKQLEEKQLEWARRIYHLCSIWEETSAKLKHNLPPNALNSSCKAPNETWSGLLTSIDEPAKSESPTTLELNQSATKLQAKTEELCSLYDVLATSAQAKELSGASFLINPDSERLYKLQSEIDVSQMQLKEYKKQLSLREEELRLVQKKLDRSLCPVSSAIDSGKKLHSLPSKPEESKNESTTEQPLSESDQVEITSLKKIADGRLQEIKTLSEECSKLKIQIDKFNIELKSYSKEHISTHPAYLSLQSEVDYYRADSSQQRAEKQKLFSDIEKLKASRRIYQAQLQTQEVTQRQALEQSLQKVQQDLMRVRAHRDQVQRELEERKMYDLNEKSSYSEMERLTKARRERLVSLVLENRRLRAHIAAICGNKDAVDLYAKLPSCDDVTVTEELRKEVQKLSELLKSSPIASSELLDSNSSEHKASNGIDIAPGSDSSKLNGILAKDNHTDHSNLDEKLKRALLEKDELEKTSLLMEHEMQAIISGFSDLEEQVTHKVLNLISKEQLINKLIAEKAKYEEKFLALNKEREAQKGALSSLKFQNLKQLEHIKNVDDRERNLNQQLVLVEQHLTEIRMDQLKCSEALQDALSSIEKLRNQLAATEKKLQVTADALATRTEEADKVNFELAREKELNLKLQKKVEVFETQKSKFGSGSSNNSSAGNDVSELLDQYKALLKCSSCRRNFKDHVLTRCMHVFCKNCIDARIETRQRKCPTCGDSFGVNDVRQIFL